MRFYVKNTPAIAHYFGYKYDDNDYIYIISAGMQYVDYVFSRTFWNNEVNKRFHTLPEFYLHKTLGFLPVKNKIQTTSMVKEATSAKQPNEKSDQKEENENMNRKETGNIIDAAQKLVMDLVDGKKSNREMIYGWDKNRGSDKFENYVYKSKADLYREKQEFPVVGQKVVILNTENYTLTPFGEGFVGKEVTVVSKFTTPETDYALPTKMVSVLIDELDGYSGVCACFRENMCHSIKTEREKEIEGLLDIVYLGGTINEIAERLYNEGYRKLKD